MINAILIIIIFLLVFSIFYGKSIYLYYYTVSCLKNIKNSNFLQEKYKMAKNGKIEENIRMTFLNVLYVYVIIPEDVLKNDHTLYLTEHLSYIEESLSVQNLYGLIKTDKIAYIINEKEEENKKKNYIYLIKFIPIIYNNTWKKFLLCCFISSISVVILQKIGMLEVISNLVKGMF